MHGDDRGQGFAQIERQLRQRVFELEEQIKIDVNTRNELLEKLAMEMTAKERVEQSLHKCEIEMLQVKAEYERLDKRMKALVSVSSYLTERKQKKQDGLTFADVEAAVAQLKQTKDVQASTINAKPLDFLISLPTAEENRECCLHNDNRPEPAMELQRLRIALSETAAELEKTRNMLLIQHRINKSYMSEVEPYVTANQFHPISSTWYHGVVNSTRLTLNGSWPTTRRCSTHAHFAFRNWNHSCIRWPMDA